jgi:RNA polymerase sigma-70 factor (ECF subfamily)
MSESATMLETRGTDEGALLARLRAGEQAAYEELVRSCGARMLATARRLLPTEEDAKDAVQEAFLQAYRALPGFSGDSRLSTWLHRIVVNAALMKLRSRRRRPEQSIEALLPSFDETGHRVAADERPQSLADAEIESAEVRAVVRRCIALLPESYRTVLVLRDLEELDTEQTAAALGTSIEAVKMRLHRARQALKTLLERELA